MSNLQQRARRMIWRRHIPGFKAWNRLFYRREHPSLGREAFGIRFPHPLGVAPVLERQYDLLDELDSIGFAFTGIIPGTTPIPVIADRLASRKSGIIASVELKAEESDENQVQDHLVRTYSLLYDFADYFIIDINRQSGLSSLDDLSDWTEILDELLSLRLCYERYKPILLRLSPSHSDEQMGRILDFSLLSGIEDSLRPGFPKSDRWPPTPKGGFRSSDPAPLRPLKMQSPCSTQVRPSSKWPRESLPRDIQRPSVS